MKVIVDRVVLGGYSTDPAPTVGFGFGTTDGGTVRVAFQGDVPTLMEVGPLLRPGVSIELDVDPSDVIAVWENPKEGEG